MDALNSLGNLRPQTLPPVVAGTNSAPSIVQSDEQLRHACREFEAAFAAALVKEGMVQASKAWDDSESSADGAYKEMAFEQMASYMGNMGLLGLADTLYEQIRGRESLSGEKTHERK